MRTYRAPSRLGAAFIQHRAVRVLLAMAILLLLPAGVIGSALVGWPAAATVIILLVCGLVVGLWPSRVRVADDGVAIDWMGTTRFFPFLKIARVAPTTCGKGFGERDVPGIAIHTRDGEALNLACGNDRDELLAAIDSGMQRLDTANRAEVAAAHLTRRGRSPREWLRSLDALRSEGGVSYRGVDLSPEKLWQVVEDSSADPAARAAAAVALRPAMQEQARARLRLAVEACADPRLRVALQIVAEDDAGEAQMENALREVGGG